MASARGEDGVADFAPAGAAGVLGAVITPKSDWSILAATNAGLLGPIGGSGADNKAALANGERRAGATGGKGAESAAARASKAGRSGGTAASGSVSARALAGSEPPMPRVMTTGNLRVSRAATRSFLRDSSALVAGRASSETNSAGRTGGVGALP